MDPIKSMSPGCTAAARNHRGAEGVGSKTGLFPWRCYLFPALTPAYQTWCFWVNIFLFCEFRAEEHEP